jgi:hypothetical protein
MTSCLELPARIAVAKAEGCACENVLAPPGTRVYMPASDVFKPADVRSIDELRAAHRADDVEEDTSR